MRLGLLADGRLLVVGLERLQDLLGLVHEVEDEGVFLARMGAVEPRERLHGLDACQPLVHVHRVQKRLVEAGLVLLGHQQHLVFVRAELLRQLLLPDALVHADFGVLHAGHVGIITVPEKATSVLMPV